MTIKIIKEAPKFKPISIVCTCCSAELEADSPDDFRRRTYSDAREHFDVAILTCPSCGFGIQAAEAKFPAYIYQNLKPETL